MRVFYCLVIFLFISCTDSDSNIPDSCVDVIFDESKYNSLENFNLQLMEYSVDGYCLKVKLNLSGCGDDQKIDMISNGSVLKTYPLTIEFDFYNNNLQDCEANIVIDREFDLEPVLSKHNQDARIIFRDNEGTFVIKV